MLDVIQGNWSWECSAWLKPLSYIRTTTEALPPLNDTLFMCASCTDFNLVWLARRPRFWAVHVTSVFRKWSSTSSQILKITRLQCFHCAATSHSFLDLALIGASSWLGSGRDFDHPPIISVALRSWQHLAQWHKINPQNPQRIARVQPDPTVAEMTQNPESLRAAFLHVINLTCSRRCCIRHVDGLKFKVYLPTLKKQSLPESFCFFFDTETFRNVQRSLLFLLVSDKKSWASSEAASEAVEAAEAEADWVPCVLTSCVNFKNLIKVRNNDKVYQ